MRRTGRTVGDAEPRLAVTSEELTREYAVLELWHMTVPVSRDAATAGRERLHRLSDSYRPETVLRSGGGCPVHDAYRAFTRQVGLDPNAAPTCAEAAALEAVVAGRLVSTGPVADALLAVVVTSGVPVWALDAARVAGPPALRSSLPGERLGRGRRAPLVPTGSIVIADEVSPLAEILAAPPARHDGARARTVLLYALGIPEVPRLEVSESVGNAGRFLRGT